MLAQFQREFLAHLKITKRRFYVAYHREHEHAVLRNKDAQGLEFWKCRTWEMFGGQTPTIVDVTRHIPALLCSFRKTGWDHPYDTMRRPDLRVMFQPGCTPALVLVPRGVPSSGHDLTQHLEGNDPSVFPSLTFPRSIAGLTIELREKGEYRIVAVTVEQLRPLAAALLDIADWLDAPYRKMT